MFWGELRIGHEESILGLVPILELRLSFMENVNFLAMRYM
jgi:hypothetical protein